MQQYLSLSEMAERLNVSARTFSKDVKRKRIPHLLVGKSKRFDAAVVLMYLEAAPEIDGQAERYPMQRPRSKKSSRFASLVGI